MESEKNERQSLRIDHTSQFLCSFPETGEMHPVMMLNYSSDGIYFETKKDVKPGDVVLLYSKGGEFPETVSDALNEGYDTMAYVKIRWCKSLKKEGEILYGAGAEYVIV